MNSARTILGALALGALGVTPATAVIVSEPAVVFVPTNQAPPAPAGLKVTCLKFPNNGAPSSETCPVVKYNGYSVWALSYQDNRGSMALVTYDSNNKVVGTVNKDGARYVWNVVSGSGSVEFFGQANQWVTATWTQLFPGMPAKNRLTRTR